MSRLVIVESPAKVKKIQQFLGDGYIVDSCVGHIRDLPSSKAEIPAKIKGEPWADYGINIDDGFKPVYITIRGKGKVVTQLKKHLKDADELLLATDEDREGESISWHLVEALNPKVPVKRMVFNEITKKAVLDALDNTRDMDLNLVQAQETRRILDRLYGYALSPLLWKKVGGNLSAGRVQSVAVRVVVIRERERMAFTNASYWDLEAALDHNGPFEAKLHSVDQKRVAGGSDFGDDGQLKPGKDVTILDETAAQALAARVKAGNWHVTDVKSEAKQSRPKPPFITSTMQQEANNRLNMSARDSMRTAQRLYENGFITYMRTDSVALAEEAIIGARAAIESEFGAAYLPAEARVYKGKKAAAAQEAHEAIRPSGSEYQHPDRSGLAGPEKELYRMIWQRTLACQMENQRYTQTTVALEVENAKFTSGGKVVDFPGYRAVYSGGKQDDGELPAIAVGDQPRCTGVDATGHETKPPARYTEATLVQALEAEAIGRPSTYASILDTIQNRGYVVKKGKALVPSFTAFGVTGLMERHFPDLVDTQFTAKMEQALDDISSGQAKSTPFLSEFFLGEKGLQKQIEARMESIVPEEARIIDLGPTFAEADFTVRIGRFGPYVDAMRDGEKVNCSLPDELTPDELTSERVEELLKARQEGPRAIGEFPLTGEPIYVMDGRFGPYYQLGDQEEASKKKPKRASLGKGKSTSDADMEEAIFMLSLPRELGEHPDGGAITATNGRFGPFVAHAVPEAPKPEYRSLKDEDHLKSVTLEEALAMLATPKAARGRGAQKVLKEIGVHPADGHAIQLMEGRYGPYLKHENTNASLPKGMDPESVTVANAVEMIAEKIAKGPAKKRPRKK